MLVLFFSFCSCIILPLLCPPASAPLPLPLVRDGKMKIEISVCIKGENGIDSLCGAWMEGYCNLRAL